MWLTTTALYQHIWQALILFVGSFYMLPMYHNQLACIHKLLVKHLALYAIKESQRWTLAGNGSFSMKTAFRIGWTTSVDCLQHHNLLLLLYLHWKAAWNLPNYSYWLINDGIEFMTSHLTVIGYWSHHPSSKTNLSHCM